MGQSVTVIALIVLQTGGIWKCGPIGDCYSSPCIANRGDREVCASSSLCIANRGDREVWANQ